MPEVSLVAILDADKEGFLRSEGSLIQTIGRAARNINGRAILYADQVTKSMQKAIDETTRRRDKQEAYNTEHNISPKTVSKNIADVMEGARSQEYVKKKVAGKGKKQSDLVLVPKSSKEMGKLLIKLEKKMLKHAEDLEFEEAAKVRDQLEQLRDQGCFES